MDSKPTSERVLARLKARGSQSAQQIAEHLGLSTMGAHKVLAALGERGLVRFEDVSQGRGRPRRTFSLTESGHNQFPDRHAELNVELIEMIGGVFGQEGLDRLIAERETRQAERYAMADETSLADKVAALADARSAEGYMARVEADGADFVLIEDHCPICAAAATCQNFCRSELSIFQTVLGSDVRVERSEHLFSGARRCSYRISPKR